MTTFLHYAAPTLLAVGILGFFYVMDVIHDSKFTYVKIPKQKGKK